MARKNQRTTPLTKSGTIQPAIRIDSISFIRDHTTILRNISLLVEKGQHWAIIGPNGSGKTSLISIIKGYHHPSEGNAQVLGEFSDELISGNFACISGKQVRK